MFGKILGKSNPQPHTLTTLDKLTETLEVLEKEEKVLVSKAEGDVKRAREFIQARNRIAAMKCLKRKKMWEQQIEVVGNYQLRIHDQMITIESTKATTETLDALRNGAAAMKAINKAMDIDKIDKTMDEIHQQSEKIREIQAALSAPIGAATAFDEDELEAELEELEESNLEEQLLKPLITPPVALTHASASRKPTHTERGDESNTTEEDEPAEMTF